MWPFRAPVIDARSVVTYDDPQSTLYVALVDSEGHEIDGNVGYDRLANGFEHRGRRVRISPAVAQQLSVIAEHGGRWERGRGFVIRDQDVPDALQALRALPAPPEESLEAREVKLDARPLQIAQHVELEGDEQLRATTSFRDADLAAELPPAIVVEQQGRAWIRRGRTFFRRPKLTRVEIEQVAATPQQVLAGDDVPYFLAKQLLAARQQGRHVILGPRAANAHVVSGAWLPEVAIDVTADRLHLDVAFKTGGVRVPYRTAVAAGNRRYVPLANDTWAQNDRAARKRVDDALDAIPELRRDPATGACEAPAYALPVVQETFSAFGTLSLSESARALRDKLLDFRQIERVPPPRALRATLREYQQHGLDWLCFLRKYGLGGVLADDMGLGKTIQTLSAILAAHEAGQLDPSLVVCPASVMSVWHQEVTRFCEGVTPVVLSSDNRAKFMREFPARSVAIASYASVARSPDVYSEKVWNYLVLDEAHRVKNHTTATAKACKALLARHKIAVTGTPIQNRLRDVWALYDSVLPGHLGDDVATFDRMFATPIEKERDEAAAARLRQRIDPFKLRRLKTEVAKDLPPLNQQVRSVRLHDAQLRLYRDLVHEIVPAGIEALRDPSRRGGPLEVLEKLLRLRQVCAHPRLVDKSLPLYGTSAKFDELRDLLDECLDGGHKVLVFTQWKQMADLIAEHLVGENIAYGLLDGSVPSADRAALVTAFQRDDGPPVLVVSLLAGGEGITLTEADTVIMYDRWWNPAIEDQAIARAHRIGQQKPVTAYILEARSTIEERLAAMLGAKKELAEDLIQIDAAEKRIHRDDLLAVLVDELRAAEQRAEPVKASG